MVEKTKDPILYRTFLHSTYIENTGYGQDAVIVSEMVETESGEIRPNLRKLQSPKVSFWVTQDRYRSHTEKKEFESVDRLDEFVVYNAEKDKEMFRILNGYTPNYLTPKQRRDVYKSPYLYGANISVEARVAMRYRDDLLKANRTPHLPTTGFFDIEKSLIPQTYGAHPLMVFTAENQVFLACKKSFMHELRNGQRVEVTTDEILKAAHDLIDPLVHSIFEENKDLSDSQHKLPFKYHIFAADSEVDMIQWIFGRMHESKVSFVGIWNLGFDIPEIIRVLEDAGIPLPDVFCDPSLRGTPLAYVNYREDKRKVDHPTKKWHWLTAGAHFQFIDSMSLFSYIRTVDGKESSYALDDILKKYGLGGKLKIGQTEELQELQQADWHREMLANHFLNYALYAMWDGMSLQLLEWLNTDITSMLLQGGTTHPKFFVNQTIRVTNTLFQDWLPRGKVLGTGVDMEGVRDEDLSTAGGAVLEPANLVAHGMKLFVECPDLETHCYAGQNDLDFSAQYPTNVYTANISKQTKVGTILTIAGDHVIKTEMTEVRKDDDDKAYAADISVEVLCSYLITPDASGVDLGCEYFGMPNFMEIKSLFEKYLSQKEIQ